MPRYFFHIRQGEKRFEDPEGMALPAVDAVRATAIKKACQIWSERPPDTAGTNQSFEVTDETGQVVLTLDFSEAFAERAVT